MRDYILADIIARCFVLIYVGLLSSMNVHYDESGSVFYCPYAATIARYLVLYYTSCNLNVIDNINTLRTLIWIAAVGGYEPSPLYLFIT